MPQSLLRLLPVSLTTFRLLLGPLVIILAYGHRWPIGFAM